MALDHAGGGQAEADTKDRVQPIRSVLSKLYVTREELQLFLGAVSKLNHHGLADLQPVLVSRLIGGLLPFESLAASGPTRVLQSQLIVRRLTGVQACANGKLDLQIEGIPQSIPVSTVAEYAWECLTDALLTAMEGEVAWQLFTSAYSHFTYSEMCTTMGQLACLQHCLDTVITPLLMAAACKPGGQWSSDEAAGIKAAVVACLNAPVCTPQQLQAALSDVQPLDHEKLASTALAWSAGLLAPAPVPSPTPTAAVVDAEAIEPAACGTTAAGFAALQPATLCAKALGSAAAAFGPTIPPAVAFPQAASYLANASAPVLALAQAWPAPAHPTTAKAYPIAAASCQDAVFTPSSEIDSAAATPNASAPACSVVDGNASLTSLANNASAATSPSAQPAKRVAAGDHTLPEDLASSLPGLVAALTQAPALTATPSAVGATVLPCSDHASAVQAVKLLGSQQHASNLAFARNPPAYSQPQRNLPGQPLYVLSAKPSLQPLACQQPLPCQQALQPAVGAVGPVHCVVTSGQKAVSIFPVHAAPAASASGKEGQASPQSRSHATTYCWDGSDGVEATCCSAALVKVERLQEHSGTHSPRATLALMAGQGTSEEVTREASTDALTASKPAAAAASVPASPAAAIASESGSQGMQQEVQVAKTTTRLPELTWPEKRYIQHLQQLLMANRNGIYLHDLPTLGCAVPPELLIEYHLETDPKAWLRRRAKGWIAVTRSPNGTLLRPYVPPPGWPRVPAASKRPWSAME